MLNVDFSPKQDFKRQNKAEGTAQTSAASCKPVHCSAEGLLQEAENFVTFNLGFNIFQ